MRIEPLGRALIWLNLKDSRAVCSIAESSPPGERKEVTSLVGN